MFSIFRALVSDSLSKGSSTPSFSSAAVDKEGVRSGHWLGLVICRDVTDSESDGIRHFFKNPKSVGYLKSDHDGFNIFVSVQLYNYF